MNLKKIISFPYQCAHAARVAIYKSLGLYHKNKLGVPVISVGNISMGGTGKTPITIALAQFFANHGYRVCVLSRGYKASLKNKFVLIDPKNSQEEFEAQDIGDEPCEMLEAFKNSAGNIFLGIGKNRFQTGLAAKENFKINLFILDDGLQHISLNRDIDLVLQNLNEKGFYREFNSPETEFRSNLYTKVKYKWLNQNIDKKSVTFNLALNKKIENTNMIGVFTGIADPKTLLRMIKDELRVNTKIPNSKIFLQKWIFRDHHQFTLDEVTKVLSLGINIITTRKDLTRIPKELRSRFVIAELRVKFNPDNFLDQLLEKVRAL